MKTNLPGQLLAIRMIRERERSFGRLTLGSSLSHAPKLYELCDNFYKLKIAHFTAIVQQFG